MTTELIASTIFEGVLFSSRRDRVVRKGLDEVKRKMAKEGARLVRNRLSVGHGVRSGEFRDSIHGELQRGGRHGVVFARNAIKGPWLERGRRRGRQTRFRGYAMFRRARRDLQDHIDRVVGPEIRQLVRELNGAA